MVEFAGVVLPHSSRASGLMAMLRGYFDDSGTHPTSEIVVMAGLFGYPAQWDYLSELWAKVLASPCPGKLPIPRFHMAACQAGDEEFLGWKRVECDFLVDELISIIRKCGLSGFGGAVPRKAYDEIVSGDLRRATGDPETLGIINCFSMFVRYGRHLDEKADLAFIFDDRPQQKRNVDRIWEVYNRERNENDVAAVSVTFGSSKKILPLQAADLLAWEIYQDALQTLNGRPESEGPHRRQLRKLLEDERISVQYVWPHRVREFVNQFGKADLTARMARQLDFD
jgi:hypothetical protein